MKLGNIVIVGGGHVGQTLAQRLSRDGHDVTLVERDPMLARELLDTLDVQVVEGNGATSPVLRQAGIESAGLVVASTDSDECNVIVGLLASKHFHVPRVIVRVRDPGHEDTFSLEGNDHPSALVSVNPETAAVERIAALLTVPGALDVLAFLDGELMVAGFRIPEASDFAGLRVSDMQLLFATTPTLAVAIRRGEAWVVPGGAEVIRSGDLVYFAIARTQLDDVLGLVGVPDEPGSRVFIYGATPIGLALAEKLRTRETRVLLVEENPERAQAAANALEGVVVIRGRGTDRDLLDDEEIERASAFVAVTGDHETNLVSGLLAKRLGVGRTMALVDNPALVAMVGDIGIDAIISERLLTIGLTLQHIRGESVRSGAALLGEAVEIVEVEAIEGSRLTSGPLMEVGLPRGVLVAARRRAGELLVPRGKDIIEPGDSLLIVTSTDAAARLEEFTKARA